jgi:hypothetical protein
MGTATGPRIALRASPLDHLHARVRRSQLDEALARGAPPEASAPLALRARSLTRLSRRQAIAHGLRRVTGVTDRAAAASKARVSPRRSEVRDARDELTRLADALAHPGPVAARGVAQAWILLTDGTGPLYNPNSTTNLRACAASATDNLRLDDREALPIG